jgi:hemoglobin/transferrin/lactoferrin receptor protein
MARIEMQKELAEGFVKMKVNIIFFLCLAMVCIASAQTLNIKDRKTGEPLEMVTLMSKTPNAFTTTNDKGQADVSAFRGAEIIEIRRLGYQTKIKSFEEIKLLNFELLMKVSATEFDEIVVSATRWSQPPANIPSKISVISPGEAAMHNPLSTADLLGSSGEVFIQKSQQGGGSPMIRGFSTKRLLYSIDGVRMNTAIFRDGNLQNIISLDPFAIENTEVFFGPGSVIYGSDAIGGVMSFQTLTPRLSPKDKPLTTGRAAGRYASANKGLTSHLNIQVGGKKWASLVSFTHSKFGNLRMGRHGRDEYLKKFTVQRIDWVDRVFDNPEPLVQNPTGYSQMNLMQKVRFKPNKKWDFQYGFHFSETSDYSRYDRLIETQANGLPIAAVWNYGPQAWMMNNITVLHTFSNKLYDRMKMIAAQQYFEESRIDRRFNHHRLRTQLEEVRAYSLNIDFEKSANKHRFYYGAEYVHNNVKSRATAVDIRNGSAVPVPDRYPDSDWRCWAAYLNYQFQASGKFLVQAGARFSNFIIQSDFTRHLGFYPFDFLSSTTKNSSTTASLGFVYNPDETLKITASASTGFRAPNVDDIGKIFNFVTGQVVVPNTSLSAEYALNGEISISKIFAGVLKLDVTAFYTFLDNAMVRRAFQVNGQDSIIYDGQVSAVYAIQNAAYGTVYGINAGIEVKLAPGVGLNSRYNYQKGKEEMDTGDISPSRHAAPAFGSTSLYYRNGKLFVKFYAMFSAEVSYAQLNEGERQKPFIYAADSNGKPFSPAWYTLNFSAKYEFDHLFSVIAGVSNLTDRRYRPYSSGMVEPGRNFTFTLRAGF